MQQTSIDSETQLTQNEGGQSKHLLLNYLNRFHFHIVVRAGTGKLFCDDQYFTLTDFVLRGFRFMHFFKTNLPLTVSYIMFALGQFFVLYNQYFVLTKLDFRI
jgi:hypothetical protein